MAESSAVVITSDPFNGTDDKVDKPWHYWNAQIEAAEKRMRNYYLAGDLIVQRYTDERGQHTGTGATRSRNKDIPAFRLNLFHTHVSTLLAMMYGQVPKCDVSRRFNDSDDDAARVAALIFQRLLNALAEEPDSDFAGILRHCLQDRLLPGHGISKVRYAFETRAVNIDSDNPAPNDEEQKQESEQDPAGAPPEEIVDESAPTDYVHWRDFLWGFARTWKDVPWVGYRTFYEKKAFVNRFGSRCLDKVEFKRRKLEYEDTSENTEEAKNPVEECEVIEIWDMESRHVIYYHKHCDEILEHKADPLGLRGFFPSPEPMIANPTTTEYRPVADFRLAQDLYNEIDLLQTRISIITKAIKVVGVYDQSAEGVQRMLREGVENDLIPVDNWAAFAERGGLQGVVDWYPVSDIVQVLTVLQETRVQTIELLYQITGLSDILRGAMPAPRESAASSMQRARFASIRVQHLEQEFAKFASDTLRLRAEIIAKHWDADRILAKANIQAIAYREDPQVIHQAIQLIKSPSHVWPWRISIKPESLAMIDYAQMQQERGEFLTVVSGYVQQMGAFIEIAGPEGAELVLELLKWGVAGYKGANEMEGVIDKAIEVAKRKLREPKEEGPSQEHKEKITELQTKAQLDMQEEQQKHQHKVEQIIMELQAEAAEAQLEAQNDESKERVQAIYGMMQDRLKAMLDMQKEDRRAQTKLRAAS